MHINQQVGEKNSQEKLCQKVVRFFFYACLYVFMYVFSIVATPLNMQHRNFAITFLNWLSKNGFLKFLKKNFCAELSPFFYISLRFICKLEEQFWKTKNKKDKSFNFIILNNQYTVRDAHKICISMKTCSECNLCQF